MSEQNRSEELETNLSLLDENPYPGRGIVMGVNMVGDTALQAYWVMGRSENSRNRLLVQEDDLVRTALYDASKVTDPSLIIYNAMRQVGDIHIVSNGDQTDTAADFLERGLSFEGAMATRKYEPDAPNYTPRISGYFDLSDSNSPSFGISVIRKSDATDDANRSMYRGEILDASISEPGVGSCVHTYKGDGEPLPAFDELPYALPLGQGVQDTAENFWKHLNVDNRVALVVKGVHLATKNTSYQILNAHH